MSTDIDTLLREAENARAAGRLPEGLSAAEQAWRAVATDDRAHRREAGLLLAHFRYRTGALAAMVEVALEVLPLLRESPDDRGELIDLLRMISVGASDSARFDLAMDCAQEAHRIALDLGDRGRQSMAINALGCFFERIGDPWQAERLMLEALDLARASAHDHARYVALNNMCGVLIGAFYLLRDGAPLEEARAALQRALPFAREAMQMADTMAEPFHRVMVRGNVAEMLVHLGQLEEAALLLEDARSRARQLGFTAQVWRMNASLAELQLQRGEAAAAWQTLQETLAGSAAADPRTTHLRLHHALSRAASALGRHEDALQHLQRYQRMERERSLNQLRWQSLLFVTRVEAEQVRQQMQLERRRAQAAEVDARIDPLTGLGNRHDVELRWPLVAQRLRASPMRPPPLSVLVIAVDDFPQLLEQHGRGVGDAVLVELAHILRDSMRDGDLLARLRGEEFLVVLPEAPVARALEVSDRLRQRVVRHDWSALAAELAPRLSIGVAHAPPLDLSVLMTRADEALAEARRARVAAADAKPA